MPSGCSRSTPNSGTARRSSPSKWTWPAEEIDYLASLLQQLDSASLADIEEIRDELAEQGYMRQRAEARRKQEETASNPAPSLLHFLAKGLPIYVGKNNTQNDFLTNKVARPNDTWLHTKDIPGSHVVIRGSRIQRPDARGSGHAGGAVQPSRAPRPWCPSITRSSAM